MPTPVNDRQYKDDFALMQQQFTAYIRDPETHSPANIDPTRMQVYRELFYNNIESFAATAFPVTKSICSEAWWQQAVTGFIQNHSCQSPLFQTIAEEFLQYISDLGPSPEWPFLHELMHYEWLELALDVSSEAPFRSAIRYCDDVMNGVPVVSPLALCFSYQYPVHQICSDYKPTEPSAQPSYLLVYRNREHLVQFMELNAMTANLLDQLQVNTRSTGKELLLKLAAQLPNTDLTVVLQFGEQTLQQFLQQDILLGSVVPFA